MESMIPLSRRDALLALPGLALLLAACRSTPTRTDVLDEARGAVRSQLEELSRDPEEVERLLAIYSELEEIAIEYVNGHVEFVLESDRLMKDQAVSSETLRGRVEVNVQERQQLDEQLLYQQDRLRQNLGWERWALLVRELNDPERMERVLGRRD